MYAVSVVPGTKMSDISNKAPEVIHVWPLTLICPAMLVFDFENKLPYERDYQPLSPTGVYWLSNTDWANTEIKEGTLLIFDSIILRDIIDYVYKKFPNGFPKKPPLITNKNVSKDPMLKIQTRAYTIGYMLNEAYREADKGYRYYTSYRAGMYNLTKESELLMGIKPQEFMNEISELIFNHPNVQKIKIDLKWNFSINEQKNTIN